MIRQIGLVTPFLQLSSRGPDVRTGRVRTEFRSRFGNVAVKIECVPYPVRGPFLLQPLRRSWRGESESDGGEDDCANADSGLSGSACAAATSATNERRQDLALGPSPLQNSVQFVAKSYQFGEWPRFIPDGSQPCNCLWKPDSLGISRRHLIRPPLQAWNHIHFIPFVLIEQTDSMNNRQSAPPLFIAVGSTHFNVTNGCLALFAAWKAAGKPAEIHIYDGVSAGFGMSKRGLLVDSWTDRLYDWLVARKLTKPA
jgi:hypothetical protein